MSWFFEKINKINLPLSRLIKKKRESHRNIKVVRNYYEELYAKKCENLDEMDKFLEKI